MSELSKRLREHAETCFRDDLLAAAELLEAGEWRPIETAPKDGTKILAINNRGNQCVCLWLNGQWNSMFASGPSAFINGGCGSVLTDWLPLPAPPEVKR